MTAARHLHVGAKHIVVSSRPCNIRCDGELKRWLLSFAGRQNQAKLAEQYCRRREIDALRPESMRRFLVDAAV